NGKKLMLVVVEVNVYFFFFQAEDGIRDLTVTGVQTCALPILLRGRWGGLITALFVHGNWPHAIFNALFLLAFGTPIARLFGATRSEERRVGKECRCRWSPKK